MTAISSTPVTAAPVPDSSPPPISDGKPETMPAKMMSETPFPMPRSEINSPSQTRNIVPAIIEKIDAMVVSASPPVKPMLLTPPNCWISSSWAYACSAASGTVIQCV